MVYLADPAVPALSAPLHPGRRRLPAHSTSLGKALLATHQSDREQVRKLLPETLPALTEHTIAADRERLIEELRLVREQGYAVDREENTLSLATSGSRSPTGRPPGTRSAARCRSPGSRRPSSRW
ncbi:IclR family transcriptional regulator [Streptomyces badius]